MRHFQCPACRKVLKVPEGAAGWKAACPGCGQRLLVPGSVQTQKRTVLAKPLQAPLSTPAEGEAEKPAYDDAPAGKPRLSPGLIAAGFALTLLLGVGLCILAMVVVSRQSGETAKRHQPAVSTPNAPAGPTGVAFSSRPTAFEKTPPAEEREEEPLVPPRRAPKVAPVPERNEEDTEDRVLRPKRIADPPAKSKTSKGSRPSVPSARPPLLEDTPDEKRPPSGRLLDPDEVPDDPSTPGLVEKLKSKNAAERLEAVNVLAKLGKGAKSAARALCTLIVIDPAKEVRQAALDAIEKIEPSLAEPLTTLLVDTSVQNAALATRKIGGMGRAGVPAIPVLIWRARSRLGKGGDFCEEIIRALVQLGPADRDALRAIINHVQSPVTEVGIPGSSERERMVALEALGLSTVAKSDYRKEIVGFLVKTLAQYEPQTADRRGRIGRGPLHDTDAPLLIVIGSIAEYGPDSKDAVPVLKRLKLDRNIKVRQGAVAALEKIDKPE